jgi:DNA-binding MarR family transcriptional regulator
MNTNTLPPRLQDSTIFLVVRLMKEGYRQANAQFKDEKLRLMHYATTAYIAHYEGISQKALSETLLMDPSDIGAIVQDLERAGYVARQPDASDRRRLSLKITAAGEVWLQKRDIGARMFEADFLNKLDAKERTAFRALLMSMLK